MLDKLKTLYHRARDNDFEELDIFSTIKRLQEIADEIKFSDLVSLSSRQMGMVAELLWRIHRIEISPIDKSDFMGQA